MTSWDHEQIKRMKVMYLDDERSFRYIGKIFGVSRGAIAGALHRNGIKRGKNLRPQGFVRTAKPRPKKEKIRVLAPLRRIKKCDIIDIPTRGECRGVLSGEGLLLELCREKIDVKKMYCKHHQTMYYR